MNWNFEINNVNQLIGFISDVITIASIFSIAGYAVFNYKEIVNIYKRVINVSVIYNYFFNPSFEYSSKISSEFKYPEGVRSNLHNVKIK